MSYDHIEWWLNSENKYLSKIAWDLPKFWEYFKIIVVVSGGEASKICMKDPIDFIEYHIVKIL